MATAGSVATLHDENDADIEEIIAVREELEASSCRDDNTPEDIRESWSMFIGFMLGIF